MENPTGGPGAAGGTPPGHDALPSGEASGPPAHAPAWAPLRHPLFRFLWLAAFVSNIGTWMQTVAAGWLMTALAPEPLLVALVQGSASLAFCLLALPAGAIADIVDRRRLLLWAQGWMLIAAAALGLLTLAGLTTAWTLLAFTFLLALGAALAGPAWLAIIPELVPPRDLAPAVVLNSVGYNLALAVGPALGGVVVAAVGEGSGGAGVAFLLNAGSFLAVMAVLYRWRRPPRESVLPAERVLGAMRAGLRYVRNAPALHSLFLRTTVFILCGSALWALAPLLAREELGLGSGGYGVLLGFLGAGSAVGATFIGPLGRRVGTDGLVGGATLAFALATLALAWVRSFPVLCAAMTLGGVAWIALMGALMVSAQTVVPSWVRGRALAAFMAVFQGGMAAGSALWGGVASWLGTPQALAYAALGLALGAAVLWRWRLATGEGMDLTPSLHWPTHDGEGDPDHTYGPVLIVVEYVIDPSRTREFGEAMRPVRLNRLRDGAMRWGLFQDMAAPGRWLETFVVESWVEHLRQHERMTVADREAEGRARAFHVGPGPVLVSHYIAHPPGA